MRWPLPPWLANQNKRFQDYLGNKNWFDEKRIKRKMYARSWVGRDGKFDRVISDYVQNTLHEMLK